MLNFIDEWENKEKRVEMLDNYDKTIGELEYYEGFLNTLSSLIFDNGYQFFIEENGKVFNMSIQLLDSSRNTLVSIITLMKLGNCSDANVLIRKLRDDLFLFLFFLEVRNRVYRGENGATHKHAFNWMENKMQYLTISKIIKLLSNNSKIKEIFELEYFEKKWNKINNNLNSFTHGNGIGYIVRNSVETNEKHLEDITNKVSFIIVFFMLNLSILNSELFRSTDYADYLSMGITPDEDYLYTIAPFIQDFIDKEFKNGSSEAYKIIQKYSEMKLS